MKKITLLAYLVLSVQIANGQLATSQPDIDLQITDHYKGLFYDFYEGSITLESDINDANQFVLNTGVGDLIIKGAKGNKIMVKASIGILATNQKKAQKYVYEDMELSLENRGHYIELNSSFDYNSGQHRDKINPISFIKSPARKIDLVVWVPKGVDVVVVDSSGDIIVNRLNNNMTIEDGTGDLKIQNSNGNIFIKDGPGDIILSELNTSRKNSTIKIEDSSGDIRIEDVKSFISVDDDAGDILLDGIVGNISVDDFSGDVRVRNVRGNLNIEDASGDINTKRITGNAVYNDAAGDITIADIGQDVTIVDSGTGDVYIRNVAGKVNRD